VENTKKKKVEDEEASERDQLLLRFTKNYHAISKLILEGKRTELEIESLLMAGQCVINDEFCKVEGISDLKELLLSDDRRMVQFGWRRLFKMTDLPVQVPACPSWWTPEFLTRYARQSVYPIYLPSQYIGENPAKDLYTAGKNPRNPAFFLFSASFHAKKRDSKFSDKCRAPLTGWVLAASETGMFEDYVDKPSGYAIMDYEQFLFLHLLMFICGYWDREIEGTGLLHGEFHDGKPIRIHFDRYHVSAAIDHEDLFKGEYYLVNSRY